MRKFLSVAALFLLPIVLLYVIFGFALYRSGEWRTEEEIVNRIVSGEPAFMGLAYRDNTLYFKHMATVALKPKLLVLGTSRSMQFSSEFFTESSFYNAGGAASYPHGYRFFIENLPDDALPDQIIMVFDQYFFQEGWSSIESWPSLDFAHQEFNGKLALPRLMQNWMAGKFRLSDMLHPPENTYGIAAVGRGSGFKADGSYCYGSLVDHPEKGTDVGFQDSLSRITQGNRRFEWADELYQPSLDEITRLIDLCDQKGIEVVGIIPPYAPTVWQWMQESGRYDYMNQLPDALRGILQSFGCELYDFSFMPETSDAEYIDGYHGGDRVYARIARILADESTILSGMIDTEYLDKALAEGSNPLRLGA